MRNISVFLFLILSSVCCSQAPRVDHGFVNKLEARNEQANGLKEGKWIEYTSCDGVILPDSAGACYYVLCYYEKGKLDGTIRQYVFANGKLSGELHFTLGKKEGAEKIYNEEGVLVKEIDYDSDTANVVRKEYNYLNGKLESEIPYRHGKEQGIARLYDEEGNLGEETSYVNGKVHGQMKFYYKSGKLKSESTYEDGIANGMALEYYESGKLKSSISRTQGVANGPETWYYENGKVMSVTMWANGEEGDTKKYNENGDEIK